MNKRIEFHKARQVMPSENRVEVLAKMIREIEKEYGIRFPFESIVKVALKNKFTDDEVAELIVEYF